MRILIIQAYTPANMGDGAILLSMQKEARRVFGDDVEVHVAALDPEAYAEHLGVIAHGQLLPWKLTIFWGTSGGRYRLERAARSTILPAQTRVTLQAYLNADLVLAAGGGYLADYYRRQFPFWHLDYRCATAAGVPFVFFSQGFGPAETWVSKLFLAKALRRSRLFIGRDHLSIERLERFGADMSKVAMCPDVALLHVDLPEGAGRVPEPTLGMSLLRWANYLRDVDGQHLTYMDAVQSAVSDLLAENDGTRLQIQSTNSALGPNAMDDISVADDMAARLTKAGFGPRLENIPWTADPIAFATSASRCELFLASRMHSAVLNLVAGVPVVGIAYEEKMRGLMTMFGLEEFVVDIENPEALPETLKRAWDQREELRARVAERMPKVAREAERAMELCASIVDRPPCA
jgi:colanic acid/amylovoran biosynthesis protein